MPAKGCANVPYGYELVITDGRRELVKYDPEQRVIRLARRMHGLGATPHRIARCLNIMQVPTKQDCSWCATGVKRILRYRNFYRRPL